MSTGARGWGSGGRSAAADLARARGQRVPTAEVDRDKIAAGLDFFRATDGLVNSLRTYDPDHPAAQRFFDNASGKLAAYLSQYEELVFSLHPRAVLVDDQAVVSTDRVEENVWFPFYSDGVRQMTLSRGLPDDELETLTRLVFELQDANASEHEGEDDSVTLLWQADFGHISFISIDSFAEGMDSGDDETFESMREMIDASVMRELRGSQLTGAPYANGEVARRMHDVTLTSADVSILTEENLSALDELPPELGRAALDMFSVLDARRGEFGRQCVSTDTLVERYTEAALAALPMVSGGARQSISGRLRDLFAAVIDDAQYSHARTMVEQLSTAPTGVGGASLQEQVVSEDTLGRAIAALGTVDDDDAEQLVALVECLGEWAATAVVPAIVYVAAPERRARLMAQATRWGVATQHSMAGAFSGADAATCFELIELALSLGGPDVGRSLLAASRHATASVRARAIRELGARSGPEACEAAVECLGDPDPIVRRRALDFALRHTIPEAAAAIRARIDGEANRVDEAERRQLYLAYAASGGDDAARWLMTQLSQKNLLGRGKSDDERIAAAAALAHVRHRPARQLLEKLTRASFTRRQVKDACASALALLDEPPSITAPVQKQPEPAAAPNATEPSPPIEAPSRRTRVEFRRAPTPAALPAPIELELETDDQKLELIDRIEAAPEPEPQPQPPEPGPEPPAPEPEPPAPEPEPEPPEPEPPKPSGLDALLADYLSDSDGGSR